MLNYPISKFKYKFLKPIKKGTHQISTPTTAKLYFKAKNYNFLTPQHIEIGRRLLTRNARKDFNKFYIQIFPTIPLSKKPLQTRMGKGKGRPKESWIAPVKPGSVLFSVYGTVQKQKILRASRGIYFRMPVKTKMVYTRKRKYKNICKL